jgi:hypothetical protein
VRKTITPERAVKKFGLPVGSIDDASAAAGCRRLRGIALLLERRFQLEKTAPTHLSCEKAMIPSHETNTLLPV